MALYRKLNRETRVRKSILSSLTKDVLENGYVQTTEERAKEVLQEIVNKYKTTLYNSKTNETVVNIPKVFEMPER